MLKRFRKAAALVLSAAVVLSAMTGCAKKVEETETEKAFDTAKAMITMGDRTVSAGTANLILRYNETMYEAYYGYMYRQYYGLDDWLNMDLYGNGQTMGDTIRSQTITTIEHMLLAEEHMEEYGVSITDDDKKAISDAADAFIAANEPEVLDKISATKETVEEMLTLYTIQTRVEAAVEEGVDTEVSDEEAARRRVEYFAVVASVETEEETEDLLMEAISEASDAAEKAAQEAAKEAETIVSADVIDETEVKTQAAEAEETEAEESADEKTEQEPDQTEEETETEDPAMTAAREVALAKAEAFLESVQNTDDFRAAADEAAEGNDHVYSGEWKIGEDSDTPDISIREATKGLEDGTLVDHVIQAGSTYYVVYVADAFDEEATLERKEEIIEDRKDELVESTYETWMAEKEFVVDEELAAGLIFDYILSGNFGEDEYESEDFILDEDMSEDMSEEFVLAEDMSEAGSEEIAQ